MKLGTTGFLFELDQVSFKIGSILQVQVTLPYTNFVLIEKVRTIKHYDRFYRRPPKKDKRGAPEGPEELPKKLIEAHYVNLKAENRIAIERYLLALSIEIMKRNRE